MTNRNHIIPLKTLSFKAYIITKLHSSEYNMKYVLNVSFYCRPLFNFTWFWLLFPSWFHWQIHNCPKWPLCPGHVIKTNSITNRWQQLYLYYERSRQWSLPALLKLWWLFQSLLSSGGSRIFQMGGAVLSQMGGGRTSCFQVKSAWNWKK